MNNKTIVFLLAANSLLLVGCGDSLEKNIVGKWASEITMPFDDKNMTAEANIKCLSDYFPNKSVTHECDLKVLGTLKESGVKLDMDAKVRAAGDWTVTDKTVYDKTIDGKMELVKLTVNNQEVTDEKILEEVNKEMDSPFVKGETTSNATLSIDGKKWIYETVVEKKTYTVTATKN